MKAKRDGGRGTGPLTKTVLAGMVSVAVFAGCGGTSPEPNNEPQKNTPAAEPSKTAPPPSSTPPSTKPSASQEAELKAVVERYYDAQSVAQRTMNAKPFKAVISGGCDSCAEFLNTLKQDISDGNKYTQVPSYRITGFKIPAEQRGDFVGVEFTRVSTGYRVVDKNGKEVDAGGASTIKIRMFFEKVEGKWFAARLEKL